MKKRKYLFRLATIMTLVLVIPIILFFNFFWKKSFEEMERTNKAYYEKQLETYVSLFEQKIKELEEFTATISADSRTTDRDLWIGADRLENDYYQYYRLTEELEENYAKHDVSDWGIYFYELEMIFKPNVTISLDSFIERYAHEEEHKSKLRQFFSADNYVNTKIIYNTTNFTQNYNGDLLVGMCTRIGMENDAAIVFFLLSSTDIEDTLGIIENRGIECYLIDEKQDRILLTWGSGDGLEGTETILGVNEYWEKAGVEQRVIYCQRGIYTGLTLAIYISEESLQSSIMNYAHDMRNLLIITLILMLVICLVALLFAYKPIHELTSELDYSGGGELDVIKKALHVRQVKIQEQEMLIMNLLLNHLIYGVPISEKCIKRLGINGLMKYYCVLVLDGYVLVNSEAEKLVNYIEHKTKSRMFVTDWQGEERSVLILFLRDADVRRIAKHIESWMEENYISGCVLYTGKVVDKLDDIRMSLRSCFAQIKKKDVKQQKEEIDLQQKSEMQSKMKEEILSYLELHYRDANLNQVQVADYFRISNYTLSRLFKNQVGVGFAEYLVAKRLEYAKELLLTTSYSVKEISVKAGFSSENYFSRTFKLYIGVAPSVFRSDRKE